MHGQAILYLCKICIQERSPSLYTHSPSSFFSNLPVLHRSSLLHCRYLSPISPPASPAAFNISAATPDGPAALPLFALAIASFTSDTDINLSSTDASSPFITSMLPILSLLQSNSSFSSCS